MPRAITTRTAFPLPDNWNVDEFICAVVPIPNDPQYIAIFRGLLDSMTWQRSFQLHRTDDAAYQVSKTWQAAFDSQELTFQNCEAAMIFRQNPANPCQLQQSHDGGETWSLAFDYSLCSQAITVPAPYPGSETGASDAAAAAARNFFEELVMLVDCGESRASYISAATAYLRNFDPSYANPAALGAIYDAFCALEPEEQDEKKTDCPYTDKKDDLSACADANGLFDLDCLSELLSDWLDEASDDLMNALNAAAAALSGNGWQLMSEGGGGGGSGFGALCGDNRFVDFDEPDSPYTVRQGNIVSGGRSGDCLTSVTVLTDTYRKLADVKIPVGAGALDVINFWFKWQDDAPFGGIGIGIELYNAANVLTQSAYGYTGSYSNGTWHNINFEIGGLWTSVTDGWVRIFIGNDHSNPLSLDLVSHWLDDISILY